MEQIKEKLLEELQTPTAFTIPIGKGIPITESVVVSWIVMGVLILAALLLTSNLKVENPSKLQVGLEEAVKFLNNFADSSIGKHGAVFASYLGTIALYILLSNIIGIFGLVPPTKDINVTAALAVMSAFLIYGAQFRYRGLRGGLKQFAKPHAPAAPHQPDGDHHPAPGPVYATVRQHFGCFYYHGAHQAHLPGRWCLCPSASTLTCLTAPSRQLSLYF